MAVAGEPEGELKPDICVIGGGAGGLTVAAAAAAFGVPVVLVEKAQIGGARLVGGALSSKALVVAAAKAHALGEAPRFGVKARGDVDFAAIKAHLRAVALAAAAQESRERLGSLGVRVIEGAAGFTGRGTLTAGGLTIKARRFVIAIGSAPAVPAVPGLADVPFLTTETVFDLAALPRHLVIVGANATGLELAQAFRRLGSAVTVIEPGQPLPSDDPECAGIVLDALGREGVVLHAGTAIAQVSRRLATILIDISAPIGPITIEASHLLIATGRRPNLDDLDLDAARVRHAPNGIVVDQLLRTSNRSIYAIGDVTAGPKLVHLARYQAELVVRHALFRTAVRLDYRALPWATFTDPELAQVGLIEDEAREQAGSIRVLRFPFRDTDRARLERTGTGHVKVITDRHGAILGATIVGAGAAEGIAAWALAIGQNLNIRAFAGTLLPWPTYAEASKRAAMTYFGRGLTSSLARRMIGWRRWPG